MKLTLTFALIALGMVRIDAQPTNCAPGERRIAAIRHARMINTAEANQSRTSGYVPLAALGIPPLQSEYKIQLTTDGATYSFSIKDTTDACHGVVFSDQDGVIYSGSPLQ
jgi:hypothetical protein